MKDEMSANFKRGLYVGNFRSLLIGNGTHMTLKDQMMKAYIIQIQPPHKKWIKIFKHDRHQLKS